MLQWFWPTQVPRHPHRYAPSPSGFDGQFFKCSSCTSPRVNLPQRDLLCEVCGGTSSLVAWMQGRGAGAYLKSSHAPTSFAKRVLLDYFQHQPRQYDDVSSSSSSPCRKCPQGYENAVQKRARAGFTGRDGINAQLRSGRFSDEHFQHAKVSCWIRRGLSGAEVSSVHGGDMPPRVSKAWLPGILCLEQGSRLATVRPIADDPAVAIPATCENPEWCRDHWARCIDGRDGLSALRAEFFAGHEGECHLPNNDVHASS